MGMDHPTGIVMAGRRDAVATTPAIHKLTATPMSLDGRHKGGHDEEGVQSNSGIAKQARKSA